MPTRFLKRTPICANQQKKTTNPQKGPQLLEHATVPPGARLVSMAPKRWSASYAGVVGLAEPPGRAPKLRGDHGHSAAIPEIPEGKASESPCIPFRSWRLNFSWGSQLVPTTKAELDPLWRSLSWRHAVGPYQISNPTPQVGEWLWVKNRFPTWSPGKWKHGPTGGLI